MIKRRPLLILSLLVLVFFSCHSYNKITYQKADNHKGEKENKIAQKRSETKEKTDDVATIEANQPFDDAINSSIESENFQKAITNSGKKKSSQKIESILAFEKAKVDELNAKIFSDNLKTNKKTKVQKQKDDTSDGLRIFLIVLLVFFLLALIVILVALWAVNSAVDNAGNACYIATMAYGDIDAPEVNTLRSFRDKYLMKYKYGRKFINWYYAHSPGFVEKHGSKIWLLKLCKSNLNVLVFFLRFFYRLK